MSSVQLNSSPAKLPPSTSEGGASHDAAAPAATTPASGANPPAEPPVDPQASARQGAESLRQMAQQPTPQQHFWQGDKEVKIGGSAYYGIVGNAEITVKFNIEKLTAKVSEFEAGIGLGYGAKEKLQTGKGASSVADPALHKSGEGQAGGTMAVSLKAGVEVSLPGSTMTLIEGKVGLQSPLTHGPSDIQKPGGFYELKVAETKVTTGLSAGVEAKLDIFNLSYKAKD